MKKFFIICLIIFLFVITIPVSAVSCPGICCGGTAAKCKAPATQVSGDCDPGSICCHDASELLTGLAQCDLSQVGKQLCAGSCKSECDPGQTTSETDDCTAQNLKCCTGTPTPPPGGTTTPESGSVNLADVSPVGTTDIPTIIGNFIKAVLGVIGAVALFMFVYGGILMLTSAGNSEKIKRGKDVLIWAIIGLAVVFGSFYLVDFVLSGISG